METTTSRSGFYTLVPKGSGFSEPSWVTAPYKKHRVKKTEEILVKHVYRHQTELRKAFGYKVKVKEKGLDDRPERDSETEEISFIKSLFILNNSYPKNAADPCEAILILAADRDLLFKDADDAYQSTYQNEHIKRKKEEDLIVPSVHSTFHCPNVKKCLSYEDIQELQTAIDVLSAALSEAKGKKLTLRQWLFSEAHVGITDDNRGDYERKNETDEDGYVKEEPIDRELPTSKTKLKKIVNQLRKRAGSGDTEMLDLGKCKKDFERLCPDAKNKSFWSDNYCKILIACFAEHLNRVHENELNYEGRKIHYHDLDRIAKNYPPFRMRYVRLLDLSEGFEREEPFPLGKMSNKLIWEAEGDSFADPVNEIVGVIKTFYENIHKRIKEKAELNLSDRVSWACVQKSINGVSITDGLRPLYFLAMVLACKNKIGKAEFVSSSFYEISNSRISNPNHVAEAKERYEQIRLLNSLHRIFKLTGEECITSWKGYITLRGKEICSKEEYNFWTKMFKEKLRKKYEQIPSIGFQLCFIDYMEKCMPEHNNLLSYESTDEAWNSGFCNFYTENSKEIHNLVDQLKQNNVSYEEHLECYKTKWRDPRAAHKDRRKPLSEILKLVPTDLDNIINRCPTDAIKLLTLESAIQFYLRNEAKKKIYDWYGKTYGHNLWKAIQKNISVEEITDIYFP